VKSGKVKPGQRILCVVPESGRAMVCFVMLEMIA
jgi:3-oxoacyl-[acyl-carrier-protein] synthase-3